MIETPPRGWEYVVGIFRLYVYIGLFLLFVDICQKIVDKCFLIKWLVFGACQGTRRVVEEIFSMEARMKLQPLSSL